MAIPQIIWSSTNGGALLDEPLSEGQGGSNTVLPTQTIYIRHTGTSSITSCGLYIRQFLGTTGDASTYTGNSSALADFNELIAWGNGSASSTFGGVQFNFNAIGGFPVASWPTFTNKTSLDGFGFTVRTGLGDSSTNAITLPTQSGCPSAGTIPTGTPNVRFQARIVVPSSTSVVGVRLYETVLKFT